MVRFCLGSLLCIPLLALAFLGCYSHASLTDGNKIKTASFLSPVFVLGPGSVENRFYYNIDFPRGHIAIKSFHAEVIDEAGNPIPLHETYLHHWVVLRYFQRGDVTITENNHKEMLSRPKHFMYAGNSGICQGTTVGQYFGLGSETRKTDTYVPDPYGIEVGSPVDIPEGYSERWMLNIHAIDTRGAEDSLGCTECRCDLYNITVDESGRPLRPEYPGGLRCCYDHTQCKLKQGFQDVKRNLYLRYTVKWVDMDSSVIPVKIFIFDVTDTGMRRNGSTGIGPEDGCQIEYNVESCISAGVSANGCIGVKRTSLVMPTGGYVIYGVAHQHTGGIGSALYGEDGRTLCTSLPTYGEGKEAGNEAGYIVGMSTCYPKPGSVKIRAGETLLLESNYSSIQRHTGVMGLFYILVADRTPQPQPKTFLQATLGVDANMDLSRYGWGMLSVVFMLVVAVIAVAGNSQLKRSKEDGYERIQA